MRNDSGAILRDVEAGRTVIVSRNGTPVGEAGAPVAPVVMDDYANAYGTWRLDPVSAADENAEVTAGKWMVLYRRNAEGSWQFWRWIWNQTSGPPVPAA